MANLLTTNEFRTLTYTSFNLKDINFDIEITNVETLRTQYVVGKALYDHLTSGGVLTALEERLVSYLKACTAWWVYSEVIAHSTYKLTNTGVKSFSNQNTEVVELDTIKYLVDNACSKAESFSNLCKNLIETYPDDFPLANNDNNAEIKRIKSKSSGGFILWN